MTTTCPGCYSVHTSEDAYISCACGYLVKRGAFVAPKYVQRRSDCCNLQLEYVAMLGRIITYKCPGCEEIVSFKK